MECTLKHDKRLLKHDLKCTCALDICVKKHNHESVLYLSTWPVISLFLNYFEDLKYGT